MNTTINPLDEARLAAEIVSVLQPAAVRACSDDRDVIRYAVRGELKLRSVVLDRRSLRRLLSDPSGVVKIDYLKRDLLRAATQRIEYRYPHAVFARAGAEESELTICKSAP